VEKGQPLATIHYNADARLAEARDLLARAYRIAPGKAAAQKPALVKRVIE
jgi:hypothetical protein